MINDVLDCSQEELELKLFQTAEFLVQENQHAKAILFLQDLIKTNPKYHLAHFTKAKIHHFLSEYEEAIEDLNQEIELNKENYLYYIWRANCYLQAEKLPEMIQDLHNVIFYNHISDDNTSITHLVKFIFNVTQDSKEDDPLIDWYEHIMMPYIKNVSNFIKLLEQKNIEKSLIPFILKNVTNLVRFNPEDCMITFALEEMPDTERNFIFPPIADVDVMRHGRKFMQGKSNEISNIALVCRKFAKLLEQNLSAQTKKEGFTGILQLSEDVLTEIIWEFYLGITKEDVNSYKKSYHEDKTKTPDSRCHVNMIQSLAASKDKLQNQNF